MKITTKNKTIIDITVGVIAIAVIVTVIILTGGNTTPPIVDDPTDETTAPTSDVVIQLPSNDPSGTEEPIGTEKEDDSGLVIDVGGDPENTTEPETSGNNDDPSKQPDETVKPPEQPIETKPPEQPTETSNNGGITIGGDNTQAPYKCDVANHHCEGPETHAYITNFELEGCSICGSHSCASFYALDQWGYTLYTPSKCPQYDIKNDPVYYCQECGKKTGDGTNGTCVRFINACKCPECGADVPSRTCHTCK